MLKIFIGIIFVLTLSFCQSTPKGSEEMGEETTNQVEEEISKKTRSMPLPESGCCPVNRTFAEIVVLDKICFSATKTELVMHLEERKRVCVIQDRTSFEDNNGKQYRLLGTKGVDFCPKRRSMVSAPFSVYFDKIDPNAISFNYLESSGSPHANNPWEFYDVDLTQCGVEEPIQNPDLLEEPE